MIHIYTGKGKGKTTAAYGLALRAKGWKKKVCVIQFLKSKDFACGETVAAKRLGIKVVCLNQKHPLFCLPSKPYLYAPRLRKSMVNCLAKVKNLIKSGQYDLVILDEIINALDQKYLKLKDVIHIIRSAPSKTELILTGRGKLPGSLTKVTDYITNMQEIKHPFHNKTPARKGVEF